MRRNGLSATALALSLLCSAPTMAADADQATGWTTTGLFSPCAEDCAVTVLTGQSVSQTPMTSTFLHFESPSNWKWDYEFIVAMAASRSVLRYKGFFSLDPEIGVARRFGTADGMEGWAAIFLRWKAFPWNDYVRTSIAIGVGPSVSGNIVIEPGYVRNSEGAGVANYFSPELTVGLPSQPRFDLVIRYHHRSQVWGLIPQTTDTAQFWTAGFRARF